MHAVHNARVQLMATAVNNLALAFIVAGFVAPVVTGNVRGLGTVLIALAWIGLGAALHFGAQLVLGSLRQ